MGRRRKGARSVRQVRRAPPRLRRYAAALRGARSRCMLQRSVALPLRHGCRPCRALLARARPCAAAHRAAAACRTTTTMALAGPVFFLDDFAIRQWDDPNYSGTRLSSDKADFVRRIRAAHAAGAPLVDGYAPFCKARRRRRCRRRRTRCAQRGALHPPQSTTYACPHRHVLRSTSLWRTLWARASARSP